VSQLALGRTQEPTVAGDPIITWATHKVTISASVNARRQFGGFCGRRSSAVQ